MYILRVIPIARGVGKESLSYYTARAVPEGTIVTVPLRRRNVSGIVIESAPAEGAKAQIKSAQYALKKISQPQPSPCVTQPFMKAVGALALEHAATTGALLHELLPRAVLESATLKETPQYTAPQAKLKSEKLTLQAPYAARLETYRHLIREAFARKASLFILTATSTEARTLYDVLKKGIEAHTVCLTSTLTKKQQAENWMRAATSEHPVCVIATGAFLSLPRSDMSAYIIEHESSRFYKRPARPFLDLRVAAERIAEVHGAQIIFADAPLRIETLYRERSDDLEPLRNTAGAKRRVRPPTFVDMRSKESDGGKAPFQSVSDELLRAIESGGRTFVYATRRGIAPATVCQDCGESVLCASCGAAVALVKPKARGAENRFRCRTCGTDRSALEKCANCDSWRLKELGIGIERVCDEIAKRAPDVPLFRIDRDKTDTPAKAKKAADGFYKAEHAVLVGTEMALPYVTDPVACTALSSLDAVLALPEFRVHEAAFSLALQLRERATNNCFVQTRRPDAPLIAHIKRGSVNEFYRSEIAERERFGYPPFTILIKLTATARGASVLEKTAAAYEAYGPLAYTTSGVRGAVLSHVLFKVPKEKWPDAELLEALRALPMHVSIDVRPQHIF